MQGIIYQEFQLGVFCEINFNVQHTINILKKLSVKGNGMNLNTFNAAFFLHDSEIFPI